MVMYLSNSFLNVGVKAAQCWLCFHVVFAIAVLVKIS